MAQIIEFPESRIVRYLDILWEYGRVGGVINYLSGCQVKTIGNNGFSMGIQTPTSPFGGQQIYSDKASIGFI